MLTDLEIAKKIESGEIDNIVATETCLLVPMRITGTGITKRKLKKQNGEILEYSIDRPEKEFLSDEFLDMCSGLPVCLFHNGDDPIDFTSFKDYVIGSIFYPYIKGSEVWGVAKIYDLKLIDAFDNQIESTSPLVYSENIKTDNDIYKERLHDINHVAFVSSGHWDNENPAIGNKEILFKGDLMDEEDVKDKTSDKELPKPDCNFSKKKDQEGEIEIETPAEQAEEDKNQSDIMGRINDLASAVAGLSTDISGLSKTVKSLVESDKKVHEEVAPPKTDEIGSTEKMETEEEDPIRGEDEEDRDELVDTITSLSDSAKGYTEVKVPTARRNETSMAYLQRVLKHNADNVDEKYKFLITSKIDSSMKTIASEAVENLKRNVKEKKEKAFLEKTKDSTGPNYEPIGNGAYIDKSF